ncbi:hypothetical protein DFQ28_008931 [Apophysomyces sp. BC1034]|nr:hypothetical protein DFQ29_009118 [Apophysomyces sp. BC1021]KAG0185720.1 hypothetical protein DFQ28_008931 [Apophysomyces sp. BC1034]
MACVDVAHTENIPFIVTATAATSNDSNAPYINGNIFQGHDPTTLYESFITRFYNMFLEPVQWGWYLRRSVSDLMKQKARVGIRSVGLSLDLFWGDSLKLVNNVFGIEPARPMGPLVELVGPIISRTYDPLTDNFRQFLDTHHHVAYIAFGQHGTPTADDVKLILTALLENIEQNTIDGFLWATTTKNFPQSVTTSSNKTYIISDLFNKADGTSDTMLVNWAPQQAVLQHPSVSFFLSHGGVTSLFEGMFSGKRMIIFPFLCDQHANAVAVEHYQLGGRFDYKTPQDQVNELMGKVALDVDGSIQENVNKHKALVQIHSRSGAKRGADFVEEVAFMNKNGKLPHRYEVAREMSFMKARNLDLYFAFISTLAIPTVLAYKIIRFIAPKGTQAILHKEKAKKM